MRDIARWKKENECRREQRIMTSGLPQPITNRGLLHAPNYEGNII